MIAAAAGVLDLDGRSNHAVDACVRCLGGEGRHFVEPAMAVAWAPAVATTASSPLVVVLDGSLSNQDVLGMELGLGPSARLHDVLLTGWRRWGNDLAVRMRGEFALILWDPAAGKGLLARDRLGGRSLFWHAASRRLSFATEVHLLLGLLKSRPSPDPVALAHWVGVSHAGEGRTMFEGLRMLGPGELVELSNTGWDIRPYWRPRHDPLPDSTREEAVALVRSSLLTAAERVGSAATTAVLVSGGVDSAAVAGLIARGGGDDLPLACSAQFPGLPTMDESTYLDALVGDLGLREVRLEVGTGGLLSGAIDYLETWELPLRPQNFPIWLPLARAAAEEHATVLADGEGGDLLFGAPRELIADYLRAGRTWAAIGLARRLPGAGMNPPWGAVTQLVLNHGLIPALPAVAEAGLARRATQPPAWLRRPTVRLLRASDQSRSWRAWDGPRWWARRAHALTLGVDQLGLRHDLRRRALAAGLEARSPLLDSDLVELVLRLPPELSFDPWVDRPLLREAVAGFVPETIRRRHTKTYFNPLLLRSLAVEEIGAVRNLLGAHDAEILGLVDGRRMRADLLETDPERHPRGRFFWAAAVWRLVTAELWLRREADPSFPGLLMSDGEPKQARWTLRRVAGG